MNKSHLLVFTEEIQTISCEELETYKKVIENEYLRRKKQPLFDALYQKIIDHGYVISPYYNEDSRLRTTGLMYRYMPYYVDDDIICFDIPGKEQFSWVPFFDFKPSRDDFRVALNAKYFYEKDTGEPIFYVTFFLYTLENKNANMKTYIFDYSKDQLSECYVKEDKYYEMETHRFIAEQADISNNSRWKTLDFNESGELHYNDINLHRDFIVFNLPTHIKRENYG